MILCIFLRRWKFIEEFRNNIRFIKFFAKLRNNFQFVEITQIWEKLYKVFSKHINFENLLQFCGIFA